MSVKDKATVERYTENVAAIHSAIETLKAFVDSLPAPDENNQLPSPMHYGHTGSVGLVRDLVDQAVQATENFWR